jgi:quinol monooxygenase YgiN
MHLILVTGRIYVRDGTREKFLALSTEAIESARRTVGCYDFVVAADPLEPDRVNIYEEWETEEALSKFRGDGPGEDLSVYIVNAQVAEYAVPSRKVP